MIVSFIKVRQKRHTKKDNAPERVSDLGQN
jgi:hypothetical protein